MFTCYPALHCQVIKISISPILSRHLVQIYCLNDVMPGNSPEHSPFRQVPVSMVNFRAKGVSNLVLSGELLLWRLAFIIAQQSSWIEGHHLCRQPIYIWIYMYLKMAIALCILMCVYFIDIIFPISVASNKFVAYYYSSYLTMVSAF